MDEIDDILYDKCKPIIEIIQKAIYDAEENHLTPTYLLLSSNAYLALEYACRNRHPFYPEDKEIIYQGLKCIVNHNMKDYDIEVLGKIREEVFHRDNFKNRTIKPFNLNRRLL